jgi:hypothetical protein
MFAQRGQGIGTVFLSNPIRTVGATRATGLLVLLEDLARTPLLILSLSFAVVRTVWNDQS